LLHDLKIGLCEMLDVDYHSANRTKYIRMMPYYNESQYALNESDPPVWQALAGREFTVTNNVLPFMAIGIDHVGEQETRFYRFVGT